MLVNQCSLELLLLLPFIVARKHYSRTLAVLPTPRNSLFLLLFLFLFFCREKAREETENSALLCVLVCAYASAAASAGFVCVCVCYLQSNQGWKLRLVGAAFARQICKNACSFVCASVEHAKSY